MYCLNMGDSNTIESLCHIVPSCSFLDINYYEEAANQFEEYVNEALIPDCSFLLNDVRYPLEYIDEFYKSPWKEADCDKDFLSKESEKVAEILDKVCTIKDLHPIEENKSTIINEEFPSSEYLFDDNNFNEIDLLEIKNVLSKDQQLEFLEVPHIPLTALEFKSRTSFETLLKSIPPMELEDIFEKETTFEFSEFETNLKDSSECKVDEMEDFLENFENFNEIILPKISEDLTLNSSSLNETRNDSISSFKGQCTYNAFDETCKENKTCNDVPRILSTFPEEFVYPDSSDSYEYPSQSLISPHNEILSTAEKEAQLKVVMPVDKYHVQTLYDKPSTSKYKPQYASSALNEYSKLGKLACSKETVRIDTFDKELSANNKELLKVDKPLYDKPSTSKYIPQNTTSALDQQNHITCSEENTSITTDMLDEESNENYKELCNDDFFSQNFSESDDDQQVNSNNIIVDVDQLNATFSNTTCENLESSNDIGTQSFLSKLSRLDALKNDEMAKENVNYSEENSSYFKNTIKCSTAFRNENSTFEMQKNKSPEIQKYHEEYEDKNMKSIMVSSFLFLKKRGIENRKSITMSHCSSQIGGNPLSSQREAFNAFDNDSGSLKSNQNLQPSGPLPVNKSHMQVEDIVLTLPGDYMKLVLIYQDAAMFYIQRLVVWEGFNISPNLTIATISLERTRFLLNQELKSCRDQNINALEGGVMFSHYIQLLILHGMLKSLNCLINIDNQLALLSLIEYQEKHGFLKGCFDDLIEKLSTSIKNLSKADSIHPKLKVLSAYLQKKYYFCKENLIPFKVLIILKENLTFFFSTFEVVMRTALPEIVIDMVPESSFLEEEKDCFSGDEEHVYVTSVSSISKDIPWKALTLVIEYDSNNSECWKTICDGHNVAHACVKLNTTSLKTLNDFKYSKLIKDPPFGIREKEKMFIVVSSLTAAEFDLKNSLDDKQNILVYVRSYEKFLPHMHFADITVDYKTSITILQLALFLKEDFLENVTDKFCHLKLKYEDCWIILYNSTTIMDVKRKYHLQSNFLKFYSVVKNLISQCHVKIKFLYAGKSNDVVNWINCILSKNLRFNLNKFGLYPANNLPDNMSEEELFLVSFPSLNPILVSILLSSKMSLCELLNLKFENLCSKFPYIAERCLKDFHLHLHESVDHKSPGNKQGKLLKNDPESHPSTSLKKNSSQKMKSTNSDELYNFICRLEKYRAKEGLIDTDNFQNDSDLYEAANLYNFAEMSVEEIDKNYQSIQLQEESSPELEMNSDDLDMNADGLEMNANSLEMDDNEFEVKMDDLEISPEGNNIPVFLTKSVSFADNSPPPAKRRKLCHYSFSENELHGGNNQLSTFNDPSGSPYFKMHGIDSNLDTSFNNTQYHKSSHDGKKRLNSDSSSPKQLNISQYKYKKKKSAADDLDSKTRDYFSQNYSAYEENKHLNCDNSSPKQLNISQYIYKKKKSTADDIHDYFAENSSAYVEKKHISSDNSSPKQLNISQYKCKKKKSAADDLNSRAHDNFSQNSSVFFSKAHKGQASQTVCKSTLFKNLPRLQKYSEQKHSPELLQSFSQSSVSQFQNLEEEVENFVHKATHSENLDSWLSQGKILLTPRSQQKLSYEKVPGMKGQTRLVFH